VVSNRGSDIATTPKPRANVKKGLLSETTRILLFSHPRTGSWEKVVSWKEEPLEPKTHGIRWAYFLARRTLYIAVKLAIALVPRHLNNTDSGVLHNKWLQFVAVPNEKIYPQRNSHSINKWKKGPPYLWQRLWNVMLILSFFLTLLSIIIWKSPNRHVHKHHSVVNTSERPFLNSENSRDGTLSPEERNERIFTDVNVDSLDVNRKHVNSFPAFLVVPSHSSDFRNFDPPRRKVSDDPDVLRDLVFEQQLGRFFFFADLLHEFRQHISSNRKTATNTSNRVLATTVENTTSRQSTIRDVNFVSWLRDLSTRFGFNPQHSSNFICVSRFKIDFDACFLSFLIKLKIFFHFHFEESVRGNGFYALVGQHIPGRVRRQSRYFLEVRLLATKNVRITTPFA